MASNRIVLGIEADGSFPAFPDPDAIGIVGLVNGVAPVNAAFLNAGGLGIPAGDGRLNYRTEKIFEAYYSYPLTDSTRLTFDFQHIANPAYNADRGPVNIFAGRAHWQF
jgi:high affinity Mn2+ porin